MLSAASSNPSRDIPFRRLCLLPQLLQHIRQIKPHQFSPQPHRRNLPIRQHQIHQLQRHLQSQCQLHPRQQTVLPPPLSSFLQELVPPFPQLAPVKVFIFLPPSFCHFSLPPLRSFCSLAASNPC